VVILDTDHLWGVPDGSDAGSRKWIWKSFTRGHNVNSMDPWNSSSYGNYAGIHFDTTQSWWRSFRMNLGYANKYAKRMNLNAMTPQNSLSSTTYCLAYASAANAEYLLYRAASTGTITVNLSATPDSLFVEWFNPSSGTTILSSKIAGGASRILTPPFSGDAVLYLSTELTTSVPSAMLPTIKEPLIKGFQNYPNPFNSETIIYYEVTEPSFVTITMYDILGRTIDLFHFGIQDKGIKKIRWASKDHSGVYFCKIEAQKKNEKKGLFVDIRKFVLLK
jgi:hypothetical protein